MSCIACNENITCPPGEAFPLGHLPIGECSSFNFIQINTFAIAFLVTHSILLLLFILAFIWKQCTSLQQNVWFYFILWGIATLFLITESILVLLGNFIPIPTRIVEVAGIFALVLARSVSNEAHHNSSVSRRWLHYVNAASVVLSIYIGITVLVIVGDNLTVIYLLLSWLLSIQILDVLRAGCYTCNTVETYVKSAFGVRLALSTLSALTIIVGFGLVFANDEYHAIVTIGISKIFLTISGYIFVIWPPILRKPNLASDLKKLIKKPVSSSSSSSTPKF